MSMPFAPVERPSLALSLLKARLSESDIACDVAYLNLAFARYIGLDAYRRIAAELPHFALAGEWVFTRALYNGSHPHSEAYPRDILRGQWALARDDIEPVVAAREAAPSFVAQAMSEVPWDDYDIIGFTSSGMQNLAALALARSVKERRPSAVIVFGGCVWEGEVGRGLHEQFPFVDVAFLGEGDASLVDFARRLACGELLGLGDIPGIAYRRGATTRATALAPITDLDSLPPPDFQDYFDALRHEGLLGAFAVTLGVETSRGCWWAAKRPCSFCGANGESRVYRSKSVGRILRELRDLAERWPACRIDIVDNVVSPEFLTGVLPELVARPLLARPFFAARPDLSKEAVALCAGCVESVQIGIESLSDHALALMHKGTTGLENIRLLKWCKALDLRPRWNLMCGLPGETDVDYEELLEILPSVAFLSAPDFCVALSLDRFSPYFEEPERHGFREVTPLRSYRYLYPFGEDVLRGIALTFEYDDRPGLARSIYLRRLHRAVAEWRQRGPVGELRYGRGAAGELTLVDDRAITDQATVDLDDLDELLYTACDDIATIDQLEALARERLPERVPDVGDRLASFVERRLMVRSGSRFLSLALPQLVIPDQGGTAGIGRPS